MPGGRPFGESDLLRAGKNSLRRHVPRRDPSIDQESRSRSSTIRLEKRYPRDQERLNEPEAIENGGTQERALEPERQDRQVDAELEAGDILVFSSRKEKEQCHWYR
jgi:hypothetical protein